MVPNEHQLYGGAKLPKINLGFISSTQFSTYQRAEVNERGTFGSTLESPYSVTFEVWRWYEVCKILSGENELFNISTLDDIWLASISVWLVSTKADWDQKLGPKLITFFYSSAKNENGAENVLTLRPPKM